MQEIKWTIENTFMQIDAAVRANNFAQARILLQNLIEYIKQAMLLSPGLMAWWNSAGLAGRMAALGFTSAEVSAVTTVIAAAEAEGVAAAGGAATVGFFAQTIVVGAVTLTFGEVLAIAFIIAVVLGLVIWITGQIMKILLETFPRVRHYLFGH